MKRGFTWLETMIVIAAVALIAILLAVQGMNLAAMRRDEERKTAINAMHYALEQEFYAANGYYPERISAANLTVVATNLWTDPEGHEFGVPESDYKYIPADCYQGKCTKYQLTARLEKESDYLKTNN